MPHFNNYPLLNFKQKDYVCFKQCMSMIKLNKHLTREGLDRIKSLSCLRPEMNSNRLN
jgi:hypothetical protein